MTDPMAGGRRRIDRVLDPGFLDRLAELDLEQVRAKRRDAEQEEADVSYIRRLLQGRLDIVRGEVERRARGEQPARSDEELVAHLTRVLSDPATPPDTDPVAVQARARVSTVAPSRVDEHRRAVEALVADIGISDVSARTDDELAAAVRRFEEVEANVSANRRRVQEVVDTLTAEIGRRYREGGVPGAEPLPSEP